MRCALVLLVCCVTIPFASGADIYVPDSYATVQDAINASADGDRIIVRPGSYVENIDFIGKAITVTSELGPDVTVIDGGKVTSVVTFATGEGSDSVLSGFTVTNGTGTYDWPDFYSGGGIYCDGSSPTIDGNIIEDNSVDSGYGCGAGIYCWQGSPTICNNVIRKNRVVLNSMSWYGYGGGIYATDTTTIFGNIIENNETVNNGAGIHGGGTIHGNIIRNNGTWRYEYGKGGGVHGGVTVTSNIIVGNNVGGYGGGGICCGSGTILVADNLIAENSATGSWCECNGGGLYATSDVTVVNNMIVNNSVNGDYLFDGKGGGACFETAATVVNNTIFGNTALKGTGKGGLGGGIFCKSPQAVVMGNTIIRGNWAETSDPQILGTPVVTYCNVEGGWTGTGNIDADPLFADQAGGDLHLTWNSPCRDAGDNAAAGIPPEDYEGDPRIAGGTADIGADEFHTHLYCIDEVTPGAWITIRVIGLPGAAPVDLGIGSGVLDPPWSTPYGLFHLELPLLGRYSMPIVGGDGLSILSGTVPTTWLPGEQYPLQAKVGNELTNLMLLEVE